MLSVCEWGVVAMKCSAHGAWACFVQGEASFEALKKSSFQLKRKKKRIMRFCSVYLLLLLILGETSVIQQEGSDSSVN